MAHSADKLGWGAPLEHPDDRDELNEFLGLDVVLPGSITVIPTADVERARTALRSLQDPLAVAYCIAASVEASDEWRRMVLFGLSNSHHTGPRGTTTTAAAGRFFAP